MSEVSEKIRISLAAARVNSCMTQREVASALKVSVATVNNWETGKTIPGIDNAQRLADLFGLPMDCINFTHRA